MKYTLYENKLTKEAETDYFAKPVDRIKFDREQLINDLTAKGSILKDTEVKGVIEAYWSQIMEYASKGIEYRDDNIGVRLNISGSFLNKEERFNPTFHKVTMSIAPTKQTKESLSSVTTQYVSPNRDLPFIEDLADWTTETTDSTLTPGGVVEIRGENLKIYDNLTQEGLFFINVESGDIVKATKFHTNHSKTIRFTVPQLAAGNYRIEVKNTNALSKNLRAGITKNQYSVS